VVGLLLRSWRSRWRNAITAENSGVALTAEELSGRVAEDPKRVGVWDAAQLPGGSAEHSTVRGGPNRVDVPQRIEEAAMYVRVVRFTDVSAERMQELLARIEESDGPPPGVPATGLKILFDGAQGTAVVLQYFESAEDMEAGGQVFSAMDSSETPGTRASVDMCEVKLERTLT
jgi:hypothetical protein